MPPLPVAKWTCRLLLGFLFGCLCGCIEVEEHLVIHADGSGILYLETRADTTAEDMDNIFGLSNYLPDRMKHYPPIADTSLNALFPGPDFSIGIQGTASKKNKHDLKAQVRFNHIDDLLRSPYGQLKSMELTVSDGPLTFRSRSGLDFLSICGHLQGLDQDNPYSAGLNMLCKKRDKIKYQFKVTLPNAVRSESGSTDKQTATWTFGGIESGFAPENRMAFDSIMTVSCGATGLGFTPNVPVRLDDHNFSEVQESNVTIAGTVPKMQAYQDAITFIPLEMRTIRTFAVAEKGDYRNQSHLIGLISLTSNLKPDQWGDIQLLEAVDGLGTNLLPENDHDTRCSESYELESIGEKMTIPGDGKMIFHPVCLGFLPPRLSAQSIARLRGTARLVHYHTLSTKKIENVIERHRIVQQRQLYRPGSFRAPEEKRLQSQALIESEMDFVLESVMDMGFAVIINIMAKSKKARLNSLTFYDKDGYPIPGCVKFEPTRSIGQGGYRWAVVAYGRPEPPFSLALRVRGGGTELSVPFRINNLPIYGTTSND